MQIRIIDRSLFTLRIAAVILVLIIFHFCYGLQALLPSDTSWLMSIRHDWGAHYLGWLSYRNEPWDFPIGEIDNYFYPAGTNVGFTDSIPLLAIFFKIFSRILPADFQYFGIWLFICHLLAAHFTILICRRFRINDWYTIAAVVFVAANPVLIYRGLHPALCAHWMLLASLYYYFLDPKQVPASKILRKQLLLLVISALVNPYICFMILGFSIAIAFKLWYAEKQVLLKKFLLYVFGSVGSILLVGLILGIYSFTKKENVAVEGGYGLYGLNLHSLYNSFGFSSFFRSIKQVSDHQYEGFMYLGLGGFILTAIVTVILIVEVFKKRSIAITGFLKRNKLIPLLVLLTLFTLFAISHVVSFNDKVLFRIPIPRFLVNLGDIFRASARFFWPVYYAILLFLLLVLMKSKLNQKLVLTILVITVFLQVYDTKRIFTYRDLDHGPYQLAIDQKNWKELISRFDTIVMYPPFQTTNLSPMDYQDFCWLAAKVKKKVTTGYVARIDNRAVKKFNDSLVIRLEEGRLPDKSLFITTPSGLAQFTFAVQSRAATLNYLDGYYYLYNANTVDTALLSFSKELNKRFAGQLEEAWKNFGPDPQFAEISNGSLTAGDIQFNVEHLREKDNWISLDGWAFEARTQDNSSDSLFFILKGDKNNYIASAPAQSRPDVTSHFKRDNLSNAGFNGRVFKTKVQKGVYQLGIAIKKQGSSLIYKLTGNTINVNVRDYVELAPTDHLPPVADIAFNAETIRDEGKFIILQGWCLIKDQDATNNLISVVLKDGARIFVGEAEQMARPDVNAHFNNKFKLVNSGFTIKFPRSTLPAGKFQLGLIIRDTLKNKEGMILTGKEIKIDP